MPRSTYYAANKEKIKEQARALYATNREKIKEQKRAQYAANREKIKEQKRVLRSTAASKEKQKEQHKKYRDAHKEKCRVYSESYVITHKEETSVRNHHANVFGRKTQPPKKNYEGMPFHEAWDPKKGGSFKTGADWIKANLGERPEGCSLHIVNHAKGFVPGNLEWAYQKKQAAEQMFKIIANQKNEIKRQKQKINTLGTLVFKMVHGNFQRRK
jgi:hypothetical protein